MRIGSSVPVLKIGWKLMYQVSYTITDPLGLHARPAGFLVKEAQKYEDNEITLKYGEKTAYLKKLFMVMQLGVKQNDLITVEVEGPNEQKVAEELLAYLQNNL